MFVLKNNIMYRNYHNWFTMFFIGAIIYQLSSLASTNNVEESYKHVVFNKPNCSQISEQVKNIEQSKIPSIKKKLKKPSKYSLSKVGKDFIKSQETCVLHAYNDPDPKRRSVGWGHQIQPGENLEHITKKKADELFEKDIEWVNDAINRLISKNDSRFIYTQGFIDGLGSLIYNCGERGVTLTEFWERWQKCRYDKNEPGYINKNDLNYTIAGVKISRISAPGHIQRRYDEHKLMID